MPEDDRVAEIGAAVFALLMASLSVCWPVAAPLLQFDPDELNPGFVALALITIGGIVDSYFLKDSIGVGQAVIGGLNRLFVRDLKREVRAYADI